MPFKSESQRKYMNWAASKGKLDKSMVDEFNKESKGVKLPDPSEKNTFKKLKEKLKVR